MNIEVHIERLVLDGIDIPPGQRPAVQAAVEAELARLLTAGGMKSELLGGAALPSVRVSPVAEPYHRNPAKLGQQIAQAVYSGIGVEAKR